MQQLKRTIEGIEDYTPEKRERMIAIACMDWGTTRRKVLEYLKIVELL